MCNGWKNRETWLVNIWFGDGFQMELEDGITITADYIRETVENYIDDMLGRGQMASGFIHDMMDLRAIDYDELAAHYAPEPEAVEG
jgi:hypothetical protein